VNFVTQQESAMAGQGASSASQSAQTRALLVCQPQAFNLMLGDFCIELNPLDPAGRRAIACTAALMRLLDALDAGAAQTIEERAIALHLADLRRAFIPSPAGAAA
jgi:hypothetical protein